MFPQNNGKAISFMTLNCLVVSVMSAISTVANQYMTMSTLVNAYNGITCIVVLLILLIKNIQIKSSKIILHFIRSGCTVSAYYLFFSGLNLTNISSAMAVSYLDPILTCLFSCLLLKEKITKLQIIEISLGFVGVIIIINPVVEQIDKGCLLVFFATIMWSFANIIAKKIGDSENSILQIFYMSLFAFILTFFFRDWHSLPVNHSSLTIALVMSLCAMLQYYAVYKALTLAPAGVTMPFSFLAIIFSSIIGMVFLDQFQSIRQLFGSILIIGVNVVQIFTINRKKRELIYDF